MLLDYQPNLKIYSFWVKGNVFIHLSLFPFMEIGVTLFILAAVIIAIWVIVEAKRSKHKMFAIFLIILILFTYFSFTMVIKNQDVDLKTVPGILAAAGIYIDWLGSLFGNVKSITTHAISLGWAGNETSSG